MLQGLLSLDRGPPDPESFPPALFGGRTEAAPWVHPGASDGVDENLHGLAPFAHVSVYFNIMQRFTEIKHLIDLENRFNYTYRPSNGKSASGEAAASGSS